MPLLQKAYLGSTPLFKETAWFEGDVPSDLADSAAVTVTASTTAHTKGAWSELIASTATDCDFIVVAVRGIGAGGNASGTLLDIGKGASGSETAIAENIAVGSAGSIAGLSVLFAIAANIPSGTRLSARIQAVRTLPQTAVVQIYPFNFGQTSRVPSTVDVLGTSTATSRGTNLAANNTWTEIVASTSQDYIGFSFVPSASNSNTPNLTGKYELGVGASGSEQVVGFFDFQSSTNETIHNQFIQNVFWIFGEFVPAGSRISIRQNENTTTLDGCIIAIPKP